MLEKTRKNSLLIKESSFASWYSASAWIGWCWSRRCLLQFYFSSCVADIMEQHGPAGSSWAACHVQGSFCKSPFSSVLPGTSTSAALTAVPTACVLTTNSQSLEPELVPLWLRMQMWVPVCSTGDREVEAHVSTWHHKGTASPVWVWPAWLPKSGFCPSRYQS